MYLVRFFLMLFILSACGGVADNEGTRSDDKIVELPFVLQEHQVAIVSEAPAYIKGDKNKLIYSHQKRELIITDNLSSRRYWLFSSGPYVYTFWWEKFAEKNKANKGLSLKGKTLYVRASQDGGENFGERVVLNNKGGVLPDLHVVADEKGNINIIYLDERDAGYQIFTNSSQDGGITWKAHDTRLNDANIPSGKKKIFSAVSPHIVQIGKELLAVWQQVDRGVDKKTTLRIYSRSSFDFGKTWQQQSLIYEEDNQPSASIKLHSAKDEAYLVVGFAGKGLAVYSKKKNEKWERVEGLAPNSEKAKVGSYFKLASDKKMLYLSYVFVDPISGGGRYWHTELVRINRAKKQWMPGSFRLDAIGVDKKSKGGYQDIALLDDGSIAVVWEDYRTILPVINFNYSLDHGDTWLTKPLVLSKKRVVGTSSVPFVKKIKSGMLLYYTYNDYPEGKEPSLKTISRFVDNPSSPLFNKKDFLLADWPSENVLKKKLKKRYEQLVQARLNKHWEDAWVLLDPVYRNIYAKRSWLLTRGRLIFKQMTMESIKIEMPYAYIKGKVVYDLSTEVTGEKKDDPRFSNKEKVFVMRWGWFNGEWYQIPENPRELYLP